MRPMSNLSQSTSSLVLSDLWWKSLMEKGHASFHQQFYEKSSVQFFRALKHIEALYQVYNQAIKNNLTLDYSYLDNPLYYMYTSTCYSLAESSYHRKDYELSEYYLESAFCLMIQESVSPANTTRCQRCVYRQYEESLTTLTEYLKFHQVPEKEINDRITSLGKRIQTGHPLAFHLYLFEVLSQHCRQTLQAH